MARVREEAKSVMVDRSLYPSTREPVVLHKNPDLTARGEEVLCLEIRSGEDLAVVLHFEIVILTIGVPGS
jgi:hypothetical protein